MTETRFPLPPGSTIGVIGAGQLGRMIALAAARLGFDVAVLAEQAGSPAGRVAAREIVGGYGDLAALRALASTCDVVTFEFENVPGAGIEALEAEGACVFPSACALAVSQDRVSEKRFLNAQGLATAAFMEVNDGRGAAAALERLGPPALLKTRREGYDGKGQAWVSTPTEAEAAFARIGSRPAILEAKVPFLRELSIIAARGRDGRTAVYPLAENRHENGVLRRSLAPAPDAEALAGPAERIALTLVDALGYVGVIGIELFALPDGALWVNEFAPRVHNSGHWTLDGCQVDQFEQHVRAVAGWPLGPTAPLAGVEMTNLLGPEALDWERLSGEPEARLWLYGKGQAAPGRKMGHVNRLFPLPSERPRRT